MAKSRKVDISAAEKEVLLSLDVKAEYSAMGVVFASERERSSGMIECYARGRDERKPSAAVNVNTGRYIDSASGENLSLWDFAAKYGGYSDWRAARQHFADKAGVSLGARKNDDSPLDQIEFLDWSAGNERLAEIWCSKHKPGASLEAIKLAGGRVGCYPCRLDQKTGERRRGEFRVICLPCYGPKLLDAGPTAWVLWNISGGGLPVYRGKESQPEMVKMKSVGETRGAMMGLHGLSVLANEELSPGVEFIWKTGGPTDLLAVQASIACDSEELLNKHLVVTNASGEAADVLPHQVALFAGRNAILCGDADEAGVIGVEKWRAAIASAAASVRTVVLPYAVEKKHGKDARDFLNGEPSNAGGLAESLI